jgi:hypothetical protein
MAKTAKELEAELADKDAVIEQQNELIKQLSAAASAPATGVKLVKLGDTTYEVAHAPGIVPGFGDATLDDVIDNSELLAHLVKIKAGYITALS